MVLLRRSGSALVSLAAHRANSKKDTTSLFVSRKRSLEIYLAFDENFKIALPRDSIRRLHVDAVCAGPAALVGMEAHSLSRLLPDVKPNPVNRCSI
jgi:hypothetical protein